MSDSSHFLYSDRNGYYWKHLAQKFLLLERNVDYWKPLARLLEKWLLLAILGWRKNGYYWKHFVKKFLIVERNGYYWKGGKERGLAG
jgi:hypothetical protein